jgi:hypothetical protein
VYCQCEQGAVPFHFKVPICDLWKNGKIYDILILAEIISVVRNINYGSKKVHSEVIN